MRDSFDMPGTLVLAKYFFFNWTIHEKASQYIRYTGKMCILAYACSNGYSQIYQKMNTILIIDSFPWNRLKALLSEELKEKI